MIRTLEYFNKVAPTYNLDSQRGVWNLLRKNEVRTILRILQKFQKTNALELGCGSGYYTRILHSLGYKSITCVDFSEKMLSQFEIENCRKIVSDIESFYVQEKYDLVLVAGVLEFLTHPDLVFKNISRMLSEDGVVVILYPEKSLLGYLYYLKHSLNGVPCRLFTQNEFAGNLRPFGLEKVYEKRCGLFSSAIVLKKIAEK